MVYSDYPETVRQYMDEIDRTCGTDDESFVKSCKLIQDYAGRNSDDHLFGFVYFYLAKNAYLQNDIGDLFKYCVIGMEYQEKCAQWEYMALSYNLLGITSANQGNSLFAIDYYINGRKVCEDHGLDMDAFVISMNIGNLYMRVESYDQAEEFFQESLEIISSRTDEADYNAHLATIYVNLAICAMNKQNIRIADEYLNYILQRLYRQLPPLSKINVKCFQAMLYYAQGKKELGDILIDEVTKDTRNFSLILEMYDDFYNYASFLLDVDREDAFLHMMDLLSHLVNDTQINYINRQFLSLVIKYYKKIGNQEAYLNVCAEHFEVMSRMEKEDNYVVASVINVRASLEDTRRHSAQVEIENEELQKKSETDALTGLPNRFSLNKYAESIFQHCYVNKTPLAVEILDIDYFKQFNDNYGHQAGDTCIKTVADILAGLVDDFGVYVARYGGDEFIILYHDKTESDVLYIASELKRRMTDKKLKHEYSLAVPYVTVSQGICYAVPSMKNKIWDYLYSADKILYNVKKRSRNDFGMGEVELMEH